MLRFANVNSSDKLPMGWTTGLARWTAVRAWLLSMLVRNITANTAAARYSQLAAHGMAG